MKNKIFSLLGVIVALTFILSACTKSEIEKANDAYNYDKIVPISGVSGPGTVIASGLVPVSYLATSRGGSSYAWEVIPSAAGIGGTVTQLEDTPFLGSILFDQSDTNDSVMVQVTETTMGGISAAPVSMKVYLLPYCPMDLNEYTGNYIEDDGDGDTAPCVVTLDPDDALFGIIINGILGEVNNWWGPPGGTLKVKLNACVNSLTFDKQKTGVVSATYGDVSMEMADPQPGWFDPTDKSFGYQGKVTVAAGSFGDYPFSYAKVP